MNLKIICIFRGLKNKYFVAGFGAKKIIILSVFIALAGIHELSHAKDFVLVGVAGFGTRGPENPWQPSGAHENLPTDGRISSRYELVHKAKKSEIAIILEEFNCRKGKNNSPEKGLIIMSNSWGTGKAYSLANQYLKRCGEAVDAFYIIDGVNKPIGAFGKTPPAKICLNFYQTKGPVHGKSLDGCSNYDLTPSCGGKGGIACHIHTEWKGTALAADHMEEYFLY